MTGRLRLHMWSPGHRLKRLPAFYQLMKPLRGVGRGGYEARLEGDLSLSEMREMNDRQ